MQVAAVVLVVQQLVAQAVAVQVGLQPITSLESQEL
jgi:hypothetical protein